MDKETYKALKRVLEPLAKEARKYKSAEEFLQKRFNYSIGTGVEKPIFDPTGKKIGRLILNENPKEVQIRDIIRDTEIGRGIPTKIVNDLKQYAIAKNKQLSLSSVVPGTEKYWKGLGFTKDKTGKYFYTQATKEVKPVSKLPKELEPLAGDKFKGDTRTISERAYDELMQEKGFDPSMIGTKEYTMTSPDVEDLFRKEEEILLRDKKVKPIPQAVKEVKPVEYEKVNY